jgi:hypothetical protein
MQLQKHKFDKWLATVKRVYIKVHANHTEINNKIFWAELMTDL